MLKDVLKRLLKSFEPQRQHMDYSMPHPSAPTPTSKPKDQPILTIVLALLLHVLLAIVVYFTVFDHKKTSESQALINKNQPITSKPMIAEDTKITIDQIAVDQVTVDDTEVFTAKVSANTEPTASAAHVSNNNTATQNHKPQEHTPPQKPTSSQEPSVIETSRRASLSKDSDDNDDLSVTTINNRAVNGEQQNLSGYRLQQTQETQQLNADIDKDSEQLSTLINEIKQRNQQQIDTQQALMLETQPKHEATSKPKSKSEVILAEKEPVSGLTYDYPTIPIADLQKTDDLR